jgi:RND family efflux transporter MFP subunit
MKINQIKRTLFVSLFYALFTLATAGCGEKTEQDALTAKGTGPIIVAVAQALPVSQTILYEAVGTVQAQETATVSSKLMGTVEAIVVREGDVVKAGELLVRLDERQVDAQFHQAESALAESRQAEAAAGAARLSAQAGAEQAGLEYERQKTLLEGEATTRQQFEAVEARYKQAVAALSQAEAGKEAARRRVQQAEAALASSLVSRADAKVTAPFDGRIAAKLVDVGDLARPGGPLLVVEKAGPYRVDFLVPETYIHWVKTGQKVAVNIPAAADTPIDGEVMVVVPSADEASRTFVVKVGLAAHPMVNAGMFARGALSIGDENMILIPQTALVAQGQLTGVFVVEKDKIARYRLIRVGKTMGERVEVLSGLKPGDSFVIKPGPALVSGVSVEPRT